MQNPGDEHWKAMERMVSYLKGKEKHELIIRQPQNLRVISYGDSSYGDCKDTRRSSSGDFHTLGGALVNWRSQRLKMIFLSSTEAEYVTMTEMAKEQRFLQMLIEELIGESKTGIIYGDNEAAMYLSKNKHVSARTKHIDIKSHYIKDHVEEGRAVIKAVKTDENYSDILTKNVAVSTFIKMSKALLEGFKNLDNKFQWIEGVNVVTWKGGNKHYKHPNQRVREDRNRFHQDIKPPEWEFEQRSAHTAKQKENVENKKKMMI